MANSTKIEWASKVWNPLAGCSLASPGCTNCYAMKMAGRLALVRAGGTDLSCAQLRAGFAVYVAKWDDGRRVARGCGHITR